MLSKFQVLLLVLIGLCLGSSIVSWVMLGRLQESLQVLKYQVRVAQENQETKVTPVTTQSSGATVSTQLRKIEADIAQLDTRLDKVEAAKPTITAQTKQVTVTQTTGAKEAVIFLGTGETSNRDWTTLLSTSTTLNTQNYTKIKAVYFEAALSIVGGEVYARLINKSTGGVFYDSQVSNNTDVARWSTAGPIYLAPSTNEYAVQLRSSSGELARLEGARIRIVME